MVHRIRAASLSKYAEVARRAGLDPQRMLSEFGLPPRCLEEPEGRGPLDAVRQLLEASAARSGVEGFGLLMANERRLSDPRRRRVPGRGDPPPPVAPPAPLTL